jgi:hypothetical protein
MAEPLSFRALLTILKDVFARLPDYRTGENTQYTVCDAALGAFSVFFMQCPSFLAYQRDMQRQKGCNNAQRLFGVAHIPSDPQIRNLLDPIAPTHLREPFWTILRRLMEDQSVAVGFDFEGGWLCSLDGTQYFNSTTLHCAHCTVTQRDETSSYAHTVLLPVLAQPGRKEVLVLEPEFITPQDGADKQDCERNAARRWVLRNAAHFAGRRVTILADDLYCNQPFCELLLAHHLDFILTCKPDSHPTLYEEVDLLAKLGAVTQFEERVWSAQGHQRWAYRFAAHVPLREPPQALYVNWCELTVTREATGEKLYHNAFATDHALTAHTVHPIVVAGRTRWKVENEGHNVLKNHGYYLEHNYGHGQRHLSTIVVMLILLAFLCHTVLQLCDHPYQRLRAELATRRTFFDDLRTLTRYLFFASWDHLLTFMIAGLDMAPD